MVTTITFHDENNCQSSVSGVLIGLFLVMTDILTTDAEVIFNIKTNDSFIV